MTRLLLLAWLALAAWAQVDSGYKQCRCGGQYRDFGYTSKSCSELCGGGAPPAATRTPAPSAIPDPRAAERARQKEREEAERRRKEAEQRQFEADKLELECSLKGADCTPSGDELTLKTDDTYSDGGLKTGFDGGEAGDTQIRKRKRGESLRDWGPPGERAWRQLHCASSFFGTEVALARKAASQADLERVAYFGAEVIGALEGRDKGEPCPASPAMPVPSGTIEQVKGRAVELYTALVRDTQVQAESIVKAGKRIARAPAAAEPRRPAPDKPAAKDDIVARSRRLLEDAKKEQREAEARLGRLESLGKKASEDPASIGDLLASFSK